MHHKHSWFALSQNPLFFGEQLARNAVDAEHEVIFGDDGIVLHRVPILVHDLLKLHMLVLVLSQSINC